VIQNKDVLTALRTNFDKPEQMKELQKKLTCECVCASFALCAAAMKCLTNQTKADNMKLSLLLCFVKNM